MTLSFNFNPSPGFTGHVDIPGVGTVTVRPLTEVSTADERTPDEQDVANLLQVYGRLNQDVWPLHLGMTEQTYTFHPPEAGEETTRERLRAIYGRGRHYVIWYVNSRSITCANVGARDYAATLPGADVRSNGNVVFPYGGRVEQVLTEVTQEMVRWVDDQTN